MSIARAIDRAYRVMQERNWDTIYWALDLHGTCLESNYESNEYNWLEGAKEALQFISSLDESRIIIWSSVYPEEVQSINSAFHKAGIYPDYCNENPEAENTKTGCFDRKFYFSIVVDDKAGFDPSEWPAVVEAIKQAREKYNVRD